jgi:anaerobic selenocysteine-containing dehydrogenase
MLLIAPWPGTEAALLLGVARELLARGVVKREFVHRCAAGMMPRKHYA